MTLKSSQSRCTYCVVVLLFPVPDEFSLVLVSALSRAEVISSTETSLSVLLSPSVSLESELELELEDEET